MDGTTANGRDQCIPYYYYDGFPKTKPLICVFSLAKSGKSWIPYKKMTEGRRSQVVLLDERRLEIIIQPKLYAGELLDIVASHFGLKEKEYFGLAYIDETDHYNWLHLDHKVLDHDFPRKGNSAPLVLHFLVKFFVEGISQLRHSVTVELFYMQAKSLLFKGQIEVDSDVAFELAAHALQATYGDYVDDAVSRAHLKKVPLLPSSILKGQPSIASCEEKVFAHYKSLGGQSRGFAIVNYMSLIEGLPTYGVHYYEVKDKVGSKWWLGLSHKGIAQYEYSNQKVPKKVFQWRHLENLYFRDRKFSIEVHDPKRITHALSSFNLYEDAIEEPVDNFDELSNAICDPTTQVSVSRRTFGPGNVTVLVWFATNPVQTKSIWSMAISQHQFYLDRKQSKKSASSIHRLSEIATELSASRHSLSTTSSASNLSRSGSAQSLTTTLANGGLMAAEEDVEQSEAARAARLEMLAALSARRDALEEKLKEKTSQLKLLCLKEAELIGVLPPETPLAPGEVKPQIRRRMGTSFALPENLLNKLKSNEEEDLASLELEFEIQKKITSAALRLANDVTSKKSMRKQRKIQYQVSETKLKGIEQKLLVARSAIVQKNHARGQIKKKQPRPSLGDLGDNVSVWNRSGDDSDSIFNAATVNLSAVASPDPPGTPSSNKSESSERHNIRSPRFERHRGEPSHSSASSTCTSLSQGHRSSPSSPCGLPPAPGSRTASPNRFVASGYIPSSIYQTRSTYRNQQYPTFSTRTQRLPSEYDNVSNSSSASSGNFSPHYRTKHGVSVSVEGRGLYNVPMQRTSQSFYSQEELDAMRAGSGSVSSNGSGCGTGMSGCHTTPTRRHHHHHHHHSIVSNPAQRYGSLDRSHGISVPHTRIESRSLDNLDNLDENLDIVEDVASVVPIETQFGAVVRRVPSDYPVSPPSPYDEPYCLNEDTVDSAGTYQNVMPAQHYQLPFEIQNRLTASGAHGSPPRSQSHMALASASSSSTQQPQHQMQQRRPRRGVPQSLSHQTLFYDGYGGAIRSVSPSTSIQQQRPYGLRQMASPSPSVSSSEATFRAGPATPLNTTSDSSPKAKEKEWYETSLDSPLSPRRHSSNASDRNLPPQSPSTLLQHQPPPSSSPLVGNAPHVSGPPLSPAMRTQSRNSSMVSPRGEAASNSFSPSPPSCDQDQLVFLQVPFESQQNCTVVSVGQFQPYREETKPYEMSDYYKYSTKVRRQQQQQNNNLDNQSPSDKSAANENNNVAAAAAAAAASPNMGYDVCNNAMSVPSPRPTRLSVNDDDSDPFTSGSRYTARLHQHPHQYQHHPHHNNHNPGPPAFGSCSPVSPTIRHSPFPSPRKTSRESAVARLLPPSSPLMSPQHPPYSHRNLHSPSSPIYSVLQPDESYGSHQGIYSPPRPMTCDPILQGNVVTSPTTARNNSQIKSRDNSFTLDDASLADAFHEEMLAWYDEQQQQQEQANQATLV